jgi:hypothetical protein
MGEQEQKKCFVIMPIADTEPYKPDHFKRVYQHIIEPACSNAGFKAVRADDIKQTNHIIIDVLKLLLTADMAICDLSSRNPNVLYELGIRQAFNLPVTLIKDDITERIFDIQGIRDVPYESSLRIDLVEKSIKEITNVLTNTYAAREEKDNVNSIISLLSMSPAKLEKKEISTDTGLIVNLLKNLDSKINELEDKITDTVTFPSGWPSGAFGTMSPSGYSGYNTATSGLRMSGLFPGGRNIAEKTVTLGGEDKLLEITPRDEEEKTDYNAA